MPNGPSTYNFNGPTGCVPLDNFPTATGLSTVDYDEITKRLADPADLRAVRQHCLDRALNIEWVDGCSVREFLEIAEYFAEFIWSGIVPEVYTDDE